MLFLTNGHTLIPYFLNYPNMVATHTVTSLQNKTKQKNNKACDPLKHQTSHTYKNICALKKCFNSDTQTAPVAILI